MLGRNLKTVVIGIEHGLDHVYRSIAAERPDLIKDQFLGTRDWPFGSALSIMLTLAVLSVAGLSAWLARSAMGHRQ